MDRNGQIRDERNPVSKPQVFIHVEFGVSWSQRHTPRTHAVTYTSRNLRNSRDRGHFPRQLPPPNTNFLAVSEPRPQRPRENREHSSRNHHHHHAHENHAQHQQQRGPGRPREHHRPRDQARGHGHEHERERSPSRSDSRGLSYERGSSAPPPFHGSPWDADAMPGPSESLFPSASQTTRQEEPRVWKPLPEPPSRFRLGEEGLPWSAWAWPAGPETPTTTHEDEEEQPPFANQPTTVVITADERSREDSETVRELETLSMAMMTVDNGFENQWWYQGSREPITWWPRDQEEPSRLSMSDAMLLSAAEPPPISEQPIVGFHDASYDSTFSGGSPTLGIVSPMSTLSASPNIPLQRTLTTRSEELFLGT